MGEKSLKNQKYCPFWSTESRKCKVCQTGIFIPMDDHIDIYCTTPKFVKCMQYSLNSGIQVDSLLSRQRFGPNRRQFMRIESNIHITLVRLIDSDKVVNHIPLSAETLDISRGGMRISTSTPINLDTWVHFTFDESWPSVLREAKAQVQWCNKQIDDPGYQIGVSFKDSEIKNAVELFLGKKFGTT